MVLIFAEIWIHKRVEISSGIQIFFWIRITEQNIWFHPSGTQMGKKILESDSAHPLILVQTESQTDFLILICTQASCNQEFSLQRAFGNPTVKLRNKLPPGRTCIHEGTPLIGWLQLEEVREALSPLIDREPYRLSGSGSDTSKDASLLRPRTLASAQVWRSDRLIQKHPAYRNIRKGPSEWPQSPTTLGLFIYAGPEGIVFAIHKWALLMGWLEETLS